MEDVLDSLSYADEVSRLTGLPIKCTCVYGELYEQLKDKIDNVFSLSLQNKIN